MLLKKIALIAASALGLLAAARLSTGRTPHGMPIPERVFGLHGAASEVSKGKDTPSGHWEIAGVPLAVATARRLGKHRAWCSAMMPPGYCTGIS